MIKFKIFCDRYKVKFYDFRYVNILIFKLFPLIVLAAIIILLGGVVILFLSMQQYRTEPYDRKFRGFFILPGVVRYRYRLRCIDRMISISSIWHLFGSFSNKSLFSQFISLRK